MEKNKIDFDSLFPSRVKPDVDDSDLEPLPENAFGEFGDYQLVGHGDKTNDYCGKFKTLYGCLRVELHDRITLKGESFKGKVFLSLFFILAISLLVQFASRAGGLFVRQGMLRIV